MLQALELKFPRGVWRSPWWRRWMCTEGSCRPGGPVPSSPFLTDGSRVTEPCGAVLPRQGPHAGQRPRPSVGAEALRAGRHSLFRLGRRGRRGRTGGECFQFVFSSHCSTVINGQ